MSGFGCSAAQGPDFAAKLPVLDQDPDAEASDPTPQHAVFAGGCFWCVEGVFERLAGVSDVESGYAGGSATTASYDAVSSGETDHAEVVRITYDPTQVTYGTLLRIFFATHDPTTLNRQGPDAGRQYRSAVFYADEAQRAAAARYIEQLDAAGAYPRPVVTTLEPLEAYYPAEDYHQDYVQRNPSNPYIRQNALPKVDKLQKLFPERLAQPPTKD
jgi:methionine-S-sulfoxide reductase